MVVPDRTLPVAGSQGIELVGQSMIDLVTVITSPSKPASVRTQSLTHWRIRKGFKPGVVDEVPVYVTRTSWRAVFPDPILRFVAFVTIVRAAPVVKLPPVLESCP